MAYLRSEVAAIPLVDEFYAWTQTITPALYALNLKRRYLPLLMSFIEYPDLHAEAVQDTRLLGGPFVALPSSAVGAARVLLAKLQRNVTALAFADALDELAATIEHAELDQLARNLKVPDLLSGCVEMALDALGRPNARLRDMAMHAKGLDGEASQSIMLTPLHPDCRPFVFSTPFLGRNPGLKLEVSFADEAAKDLLRSFDESIPVGDLAQAFGLDPQQRDQFKELFTDKPPPRRYSPPPKGALRWRHFGHACVSVETATTTLLLDPLISHYKPDGSPERLSFDDLPDVIDAVVITHNHQDHCVLETLMRLRHRIKRILVPRALDTLEDPSLVNSLRRIGFANVTGIEEFETVQVGDIFVTGFPFLGEHGDLRVSSKLTYKVVAGDRSLFFAADSDCHDIATYRTIMALIGTLDTIFIGMECEGAPVSWLYGPVFRKALSRVQDDSRRLSGADGESASALVDLLQPRAAYVYAMGDEPWVSHISAKQYDASSLPMIEVAKFMAHCRHRGIESARLVGSSVQTLAFVA